MKESWIPGHKLEFTSSLTIKPKQQHVCILALYRERRERRGRGRRRLHSEENSEMQQQPTAWSRGRTSLCSQKSLSLSPLFKTKSVSDRLVIVRFDMNSINSAPSPPTA